MANTDIATYSQQVQKRVIDKIAKERGEKAIDKMRADLRRRQLEIEYVPIGNVEPNDYNPNRQGLEDFDMLIGSMAEDGFTQPILVREHPTKTGVYVIVDGEHRWRASQVLSFETIPVVVVEMTEVQARIATIRHNEARGSHDAKMESGILETLTSMGQLEWVSDALGLDEAAIDRLSALQVDESSFDDLILGDEFTDEEKALIENGVPEIMAVQEAAKDGKLIAASPEALERQRMREALLERARRAEDLALKTQPQLFRVSLAFGKEEGALVKGVLGTNPTHVIIQLCQKAVEAGDVAE